MVTDVLVFVSGSSESRSTKWETDSGRAGPSCARVERQFTFTHSQCGVVQSPMRI
jgi:hypothetical protein